MKLENNYFPSITIGEEIWVGKDPMGCAEAYAEASRMKTDYNTQKACVMVFTPDILRIVNWEKGDHRFYKGAYLYSIPV